MISRDEIMRRATMAPWEPETVEYDMGVSPKYPTGADCSAYVTWCWNALGDFNTETLVSSGLMYEIPFDSALRGDAMGRCGPGTSGANGHIQLFDKWLNDDPNDSHYYCWQQNGVGLGPHYDLVDMEPNYKAYRFTGVSESTEETAMTLEIPRDSNGVMWISRDRIDRRPLYTDEDVMYYLNRGAIVPVQPETAANGAACVADIRLFGVEIRPDIAAPVLDVSAFADELARRLQS